MHPFVDVLYACFFVKQTICLQSSLYNANWNIVISTSEKYTVVIKLKSDPHFGVITCSNVDLIDEAELAGRVHLVEELLEAMIQASKYQLRMLHIKMELAMIEGERTEYRANRRIWWSELTHLNYLENLLLLLNSNPGCYQSVRNYLLSL